MRFSFLKAGLPPALFFASLLALPTAAQTPADSLARPAVDTTADTVQMDGAVETEGRRLSRFHSPRRATLLSAALPGLGQLYNRTHWYVELPLIYGGAAVLGYLIYDNNRRYVAYRDAFLAIDDGNPATQPDYANIRRFNPSTSDRAIQFYKDTYRRYRDLNIILSIALYALNVVDANVFAHLREFDLDDDLSLRVVPASPGGYPLRPPVGVTVALGF